MIALFLGGAALAAGPLLSRPVVAADPAAVVATYADIAAAGYADSLTTAIRLRDAVAAFLANPSDRTHEAARQAWLAARVPYQQTEVFRFGNPRVDEWEGRVNAWPLDEGLIDYTADSYGEMSEENPWYTANLIAQPRLEVAGETIDATTIDADLLRQLHEIDEVEANVSTGYHAIEFLLWGQDLNGTDAGAGARPWTDFAAGDACTGGHCDRRRQYLTAASDLLIGDLEEMVEAWGTEGPARAEVTADPNAGLAAMLTGLGSLAYGELAGERTKLGLLLNDPEEEHDCFSDNTHNSHFFDVLGMQNVWAGRYARVDGTTLEGASLRALTAAADPAAALRMSEQVAASLAAARAVKEAADSGRMAYDQMLAPDNAEGNALLQRLVEALIAQTRATEEVVAALGLERLTFEGSDSLDNPGAVQ